MSAHLTSHAQQVAFLYILSSPSTYSGLVRNGISCEYRKWQHWVKAHVHAVVIFRVLIMIIDVVSVAMEDYTE